MADETLQEKADRLSAAQADLDAAVLPLRAHVVEILTSDAVQLALMELGEIRAKLPEGNAKLTLDGLISRVGFTLNVFRS